MKKIFLKIRNWILKFIAFFFIFSIVSVILLRWIPVYFTPLMFTRLIDQFEKDQAFKIKHTWVSYEEISDKAALAVICSEDQNFLNHNGFDWEAMKKAYNNNKKGKRIKGGSTISQQTAKNVFLWQGRSYLRKGLEAYFTFLIELFWNKKRIIEVYLNSIEMGNGIYGIEEASKYWFKKSAKKLSSQEAAAIAAILPNPLKYKANPQSVYIYKRKMWIVGQMYNSGLKLEF